MKELDPHRCEISEYKGNPIFQILKVDEDGNPVEKYATIVSFGKTKARYILENIEQIKKFVEGQEL